MPRPKRDKTSPSTDQPVVLHASAAPTKSIYETDSELLPQINLAIGKEISEQDIKALAKSYYDLTLQLSIHASMGVNRNSFEQSYNYDVRKIELEERLKRAKELFEEKVKVQIKW